MVWKTLNAVLIAAGLMLVYALLSLSAHGAPYPDHSELRPTCRVVYSLTEPAVDLPEAMCGENGVVDAWFNCEVNGWWSHWDTPADAVNPVSGARGIAQVMPEWAPKMAKAGLDYSREHDRLVWAGYLWSLYGARQWQCAQ